jgi:hypothetical protein
MPRTACHRSARQRSLRLPPHAQHPPLHRTRLPPAIHCYTLILAHARAETTP